MYYEFFIHGDYSNYLVTLQSELFSVVIFERAGLLFKVNITVFYFTYMEVLVFRSQIMKTKISYCETIEKFRNIPIARMKDHSS